MNGFFFIFSFLLFIFLQIREKKKKKRTFWLKSHPSFLFPSFTFALPLPSPSRSPSLPQLPLQPPPLVCYLLFSIQCFTTVASFSFSRSLSAVNSLMCSATLYLSRTDFGTYFAPVTL